MKMKETSIVGLRSNPVVWITPEKLRALALDLESKMEETKGQFGQSCIGSALEGKIYFQCSKSYLESLSAGK